MLWAMCLSVRRRRLTDQRGSRMSQGIVWASAARGVLPGQGGAVRLSLPLAGRRGFYQQKTDEGSWNEWSHGTSVFCLSMQFWRLAS